jgi:hypothetical protein
MEFMVNHGARRYGRESLCQEAGTRYLLPRMIMSQQKLKTFFLTSLYMYVYDILGKTSEPAQFL